MEGKDFSCFKDHILILPSHDETEQDQAAVERLKAVEIVELVEQGFKHTAAALTMVGGNIGLSPVVNMFPDLFS